MDLPTTRGQTLSDEPANPGFHPYLIQTFDAPDPAHEGIATLLPIHPPRGFMLHSWAPASNGTLAVLWVRYKSDQVDLLSGFALSALDRKAENG